MSDPITAILDAHDTAHTRNDSLAMLLTLASEDRPQLGALLLQALVRRSPSSTFLDTALDLLPDEAVVPVCSEAWRRYRDGERGELLASVIEFTSNQAPQVLQDDWEALLALATEDELQLASQVWQGLPSAISAQWARILAEADDDREMARAKALLLAAQPETYAVARGYLADWGALDAEVWAHWAGVADGSLPRRLHGKRSLHIRFGREQHRAQQADEPSWRKRTWRLHPTWNGGQVHHAGQMGGPLEALCSSCHAPLQRLLQTDAAALQPGASGEITLGLCLDCCGWEDPPVRFYRHDAAGLPSCHPSQHREVPNTPTDSGDLMQAEVGLVAMDSARWQQQDWGQSNHRQNLSRVGGAPSWVQSAWYPACIDCGEEMPFVMQLDSTLPTTGEGTLLWGSGGMLYTFWCAKCRVSGHFWQCT
ncbi:TPA: hypothetical protein UMX25_004345 [Stenotrophomonas maltophilia]|uniref:hypothetical protein n=1 Tax=Stenotrophomonas maltophilia TaxID=40324 RepID=UPI002A9D8FFF|nr:hypothetical protein [Stenotrophomonas maltophilia]HEL3835256.1 hypothetical protein [Stenotrophomonas maltophilia]HEL4225137.1 hypothetical protein [Stenotrophomonas maltophilia]HEL4229201.1 hypothetical protein [Stenotrophomonas maltophilia]